MYATKSCEANKEVNESLKFVKALQMQKQNKALIEKYHAIAASKGKAWSDLTEDEIIQMIVENETADDFIKKKSQLKCKMEDECVVELPNISSRQHFNLMVGDSKQVLDHISQLTERFSLLDPEFTYWLMTNIGQRPFTTFGYFPAPADPVITKQVIGKDGYYFKLTTTNTGVNFIWHDRKENHFLFWGPKTCVIQAMKIIQSRMRKINLAKI